MSPVGDPTAYGEPTIDGLPDGVIELGADRKIISVNPAALRLTGHAESALLGRRCSEVLEPRDDAGKALLVDGWHPSVRLQAVSVIPEHEVVLSGADGTDVRTFVTGRYHRDESGHISGATLMLRDAGRRRELAAAGAQVVSTVSHELRSPLTSVKGYTSLLLNRWERLKDDQKRMMLEQVHHDADRVTRLITELLDISRLETGRLVLRRQMVNLPGLAASVAEKVGLEYPDLDASVSFPDEFPRVWADPDKIEQVLTNLVENACKYASPKGLSVVGEAYDGEVTVTVTDAGEGIPEADLPKVFSKFFRRDLGKPTGSGLGLWISRGLVEAHGGRLSASSIPGQGTAFRFTLPTVDPDELQPA
jgi:PAS domain S-box-containing protein